MFVLRRFDLQPNMRERSPVVKRDRTIYIYNVRQIIWGRNKNPVISDPGWSTCCLLHLFILAPVKCVSRSCGSNMVTWLMPLGNSRRGPAVANRKPLPAEVLSQCLNSPRERKCLKHSMFAGWWWWWCRGDLNHRAAMTHPRTSFNFYSTNSAYQPASRLWAPPSLLSLGTTQSYILLLTLPYHPAHL